MAISLGLTPILMSVALSRDADFVSAIISDTGDWPAGTIIELRFTATDTSTPIVWPATIDGDTASWEVDKLVVRQVIDADATKAKLYYGTTGNVDLLWARGSVQDVT